jgi:hypothetical protein
VSREYIFRNSRSGEAADQTVEVDKTLAAGTERSLGRFDTVVGFAIE